MENMMNPFETNVDAGQGFGWNAAGIGAAMLEGKETSAQDISQLLQIVGYIAGRRNTLTPYFDQEKATQQYKAKYAEIGGEADSITQDGEEIKKSFSQSGYDKLFGAGAMDQLKSEGNFYKLNVKEGNPEYLVCKSKVIDSADSNMKVAVRKGTAASSANSDVLVIKPKQLAEILYNTSSKGIIYILDADNNEVAIFSPQRLESFDKKTNKRKYVVRYFPVLAEGGFEKYVPQLGCIKNITHAVNKNFAGEPIKGEINLSNRKQIEDRYPELLDKLNTIGIALDRKATKGTDQTIPYDEFRDEYVAMGVDENLLERLRQSKSSSTAKIFTLSDIQAGFLGEN